MGALGAHLQAKKAKNIDTVVSTMHAPQHIACSGTELFHNCVNIHYAIIFEQFSKGENIKFSSKRFLRSYFFFKQVCNFL